MNLPVTIFIAASLFISPGTIAASFLQSAETRSQVSFPFIQRTKHASSLNAREQARLS